MDKKSKSNGLTEGSIGKTILRLTYPMIFGMVSMIVFNLVDTFFIAKLGTQELAAITFTFPVVLIITSVAHGMGMGAASVVSRAVGEGNRHKVQRYGTDSLVLSFIFVIIFVIVGLFLIEPIFQLLGATDHLMVYIKE